MTGAILSSYVITANPTDYPGKHVMRRHAISRFGSVTTPEHYVVDTLEEARALVPRGCVCIPRQPADDPVVVECWI